MTRPCQCDNFSIKDGVAEPYLEGRDCRRCFLFATNPEVNRAWGGDGSVLAVTGVAPILLKPSVPVALPCIHEGKPCPPPEGKDRNKKWQICDAGKGIVCACTCNSSCDLYEADEPEVSSAPSRRHCLMHVLPVPGNGVWRRSLDQLRLRLPLFDGRVVLAVFTGEYKGKPLDAPELVKEYLPAAEIIRVPNQPHRREVATWKPLWESLLPDLGDSDAVFYCHTKGATRQVDPGNSCQWWASLMWSLGLDHWEKTESLLRRYPIVGSFKKVGYGFGHDFGRWHYSGTFFWLRASDFKARRYRVPVPEMWWGVEAWPGIAYDVAEAGCLFLPGQVPQLNLYSPSFWNGTVRPEYSQWMQSNRPEWPWLKAAPSR